MPGEIHIGGAGVAQGYLNRPDLTALHFVPEPDTPEPGARMYRTGDLGRWLADGTVEFLGRMDTQVKIRGFRIEPGEVEAALQAHPQVRQAVVLVREDRPGDKRLVAYCTFEGDGPGVDPAALREHLLQRLPDYMVPSAFVPLQALPLTPHGKLDRRALPAPEDDAYDARAYEPPQGEAEMALAALWSELLGIERIGRHDNFFALGGHSLLAVQLMSRVHDQLGVQLPMSRLFAQPTLSQLAQHVRDAQPAQPEDAISSINVDDYYE
jgi:acyl carrier protein